MVELAGIAIRKKSRAPMVALQDCELSMELGLAGDFRGKPGKRQVTVLSEESWLRACNELGHELPWLTRRANLLVRGLEFSAGDVGKVLCIGVVKLQITRETDPCQRMEDAQPGLKNALAPDWRGGVCCRVLVPGQIAVGATVQIIPATGFTLQVKG